MTEKNYDKISPTAIDVAFSRARFTNMPYTHEMFEQVRKHAHIRWYLKVPSWLLRLAILFPKSTGNISGLEIRYLSTNTILEKLDESWAIIEIAAGISYRSLEWNDRKNLYIETDLPDMLETKKEIYRNILENKGMEESQNHHFEVLNALDSKNWEDLGEKYFKERKLKIAIINEGLFGYLTREEKKQLRDNIKTFLQRYATEGAWISPDFNNQHIKNGTWITHLVEKKTEKKTERNFDFFKNHDEITEFLQEGGFKTEFPSNDDILDKLTCIPKMHFKREKIQPQLAWQQVCIAKPLK